MDRLETQQKTGGRKTDNKKVITDSLIVREKAKKKRKKDKTHGRNWPFWVVTNFSAPINVIKAIEANGY